MGIRECFVPRPGHVFAQADYSGLELCTLSQVCLDLFGKSEMAKVINAGKDVHSALASDLLGITYEEAMARKAKSHPLHKEFNDARQISKAANFGYPGGLGPKKFVAFAARSGIELSLQRAKDLKQQWLERWPEMRYYFRFINDLQDEKKAIRITQVRSNRVRMCLAPGAYTAACNTLFQGLGADATAGAYWLIMNACYVYRESPLFGCRVVNFVHDEFIVEAPEASAAEAAEELSRLMVTGAAKWVPDVRLEAEPCLMRLWSKDAQTLRDDGGRLVVWEPKEKAA